MKRVNCYPLIYKKLVCDYYYKNKGIQSISDIVKLFNISNGTLYNWINKCKSNNLTEKKHYTKNSKYTPEIKCYIRAYVLKYNEFDYKKLIISIKRKYRLVISRSMIYKIIGMMNITRKKFKRRIIPNSKKQNTKIKKFKKQFTDISKDDIISIDETSINTHISSDYGWGLKGTKIIKVNKKSKVTYTIISAISNKKVICNKVIKGSSNAIQFKEFLQTVASNFIDKKYLLMDNARIHHSKIVLDYVRTTNHQIIYNVPYCPEYNPIELIFSKFKSIVKKKNNETSIKLLKNIEISFKKILKRDLVNCYKHSLNF